MAATLLEEETKRDSLANVIELAEAKCAELAGVNETLEELLSQLQPLVVECTEKLKPSERISRSVRSSHASQPCSVRYVLSLNGYADSMSSVRAVLWRWRRCLVKFWPLRQS